MVRWENYINDAAVWNLWSKKKVEKMREIEILRIFMNKNLNCIQTQCFVQKNKFCHILLQLEFKIYLK